MEKINVQTKWPTQKQVLSAVAWTLIVLCVLIFGFLVYYYCRDYYTVNDTSMDLSATGQFGDFVGGFIGTLISVAAFIFLYLTFKEQRENFSRERFESKFFDLLKIHRENVSELSYSKFYLTKKTKSENRKVFRVIYREFLECYKEIRNYSNSTNPEYYMTPAYIARLNNIIQQANINPNMCQLALVDIAYSIVFFGVGEEGVDILKDRFRGKYDPDYTDRLIAYIRCKPKEENKSGFNTWKQLRNNSNNLLQNIINELLSIHNLSMGALEEYLSDEKNEFIYDLYKSKKYDKYYGGHQHRLGHYYRHLYQCYNYLNTRKELSDEEKYFYGKTLRSQLSTYEQALLFINSISSLGMRWEFTPEGDLADNRLITKYQLIKNVAGKRVYKIKYSDYYPNVQYESNDL